MFEIRHYIRLETIWARCQTYGGYRIFVWTRLPLPLLSLTHRHKGPSAQPSSPQHLFLTTGFSVSSEPRRASPSRGARPPRAGAGWPEARRHGAPNAATDWSSQRRPHGEDTGGGGEAQAGGGGARGGGRTRAPAALWLRRSARMPTQRSACAPAANWPPQPRHAAPRPSHAQRR